MVEIGNIFLHVVQKLHDVVVRIFETPVMCDVYIWKQHYNCYAL